MVSKVRIAPRAILTAVLVVCCSSTAHAFFTEFHALLVSLLLQPKDGPLNACWDEVIDSAELPDTRVAGIRKLTLHSQRAARSESAFEAALEHYRNSRAPGQPAAAASRERHDAAACLGAALHYLQDIAEWGRGSGRAGLHEIANEIAWQIHSDPEYRERFYAEVREAWDKAPSRLSEIQRELGRINREVDRQADELLTTRREYPGASSSLLVDRNIRELSPEERQRLKNDVRGGMIRLLGCLQRVVQLLQVQAGEDPRATTEGLALSDASLLRVLGYIKYRGQLQVRLKEASKDGGPVTIRGTPSFKGQRYRVVVEVTNTGEGPVFLQGARLDFTSSTDDPVPYVQEMGPDGRFRGVLMPRRSKEQSCGPWATERNGGRALVRFVVRAVVYEGQGNKKVEIPVRTRPFEWSAGM